MSFFSADTDAWDCENEECDGYAAVETFMGPVCGACAVQLAVELEMIDPRDPVPRP